ncbi:MAG: YHS domain-containing protein [Chloroflexi bacterium]|nr:YHS domain-containing protein [Chloroflexota bacterium]
MDSSQPTPLPMATTPLGPGEVIDPVCGMTVRLEDARTRGLTFVHEGTEHGFCGRGCRLDFEEDPARYLDPGYVPSM